jgi:AcrR family transcriptional regulator
VVSRSIEVQETAVVLFYERGYHATSLKDIAKRMNLRAPSLYNHIESKQKLLREIMFNGIESLESELDSAIASSEDVTEKIRLGAEAHIRHHIRNRIQAYVNTYEIPSLDEPARSELLARRRRYARKWEALISQAVAEGRAWTLSPKLAAFSIIDLGAGVARWHRPGVGLPEDELVAYYGDLALRIAGAGLGSAG